MIELIKEMQNHMRDVYSSQQISKLTAGLGPKHRQILELLSAEPAHDDDAIKSIVYPDDKGSGAYEKAKQRLYFELIQVYFLPNQARSLEDFDLYRNKSIEYTSLAKMMSATPCLMNIKHLVREGLKFSKQIGITENVIELLRIELHYAGAAKQNPILFNKTLKEYQHYVNLNEMESNLQIEYLDIYSKTRAHNYIPENSADILKRMRYNLDQNYSFKMNTFSFRVKAIVHEINANYRELFNISEEAVIFYTGLKIRSERLEMFFIRRKYIASLSLKKYDDLREIFATYFERIPKYSNYWFIFKSYNAIILVHDRQYAAAQKSLPTVQKYSKHLPENAIELFTLTKGIAKLMVRLEAQVSDMPVPKFRLYKLVNDLPVHAKNKTGINLTILVVQIMYLMGEQKYDDIIDRVDALRQYSYRYLKKNAVRSNTFIKMIIEMSKADFNPIRTQRYTEKLVIKLESIPLELAEQPFEVEIVPYEHLWQLITRLLDKNAQPSQRVLSE